MLEKKNPSRGLQSRARWRCQRSTVSEIVESLTAEGLIEEIGEGDVNGWSAAYAPAAAVCGRDGYRSKYHPDLHYSGDQRSRWPV